MFTVDLGWYSLTFRFEHIKLHSDDKTHVTNCYASIDNRNRFYYYGSAFCSKSDKFNETTGEWHSLERAVAALGLEAREIVEVYRAWRDSHNPRKPISFPGRVIGILIADFHYSRSKK